MNGIEQRINDYHTAVGCFRRTNPALREQRAEHAGRAASIALIIAFCDNEPLDVWHEISMKWALVACAQDESVPFALAQ